MRRPPTKLRTRISFILGILTFSFSTVGCSPDVQSAHEPMHPLSGESVAIRATATGYVGKIDLWIGESQIAADSSLAEITPLTIVKTCDPFFWVRSLTCIFVVPKSDLDGRMIAFKATATSPLGGSKSEKYQFAAGAYPSIGQPIPIRVKGDALEKLDIVLIRDEEIPPGFFRRYLDDIIEESFFAYSTFRESRGLYNFYYSTETGKYSDNPSVQAEWCQFQDPDNMDALMATADVIVFLHTGVLADCKKSGKFSSEIWLDKSLVHESGHALFGLRDEYPAYFVAQCSPPRNVWDSEEACQEEAPSLGLDPSDCVVRGPGGTRWKIDPEGPTGCIMNGWRTQLQAGSDYGPACLSRIKWRYQKCVAGECMTAAVCPDTGD